MNLFPHTSAPYVIMAPAYTEKSAGVKTLHLLCHALNCKGQKAYMVLFDGGQAVNPFLNTPLWTAPLAQGYLDLGLDAIAVYPEVIKGNPLQAKHVVRYLLYYAGVYGGDIRFPESDLIWAFSAKIARAYGMEKGKEKFMFLPAVDPAVFHPPVDKNARREGKYFYAHKYRSKYNGTLQEITRDCKEITVERAKNNFGLAEILRSAEVLYAYEDSAIIIAATLCGCPVAMLPSEHFTSSVGIEETMGHGIAWGVDELEKARKTVSAAYEDYPILLSRFWSQLNKFIEETQKACHVLNSD